MPSGPARAAETFRRFERKMLIDPAKRMFVAAWLRHTCRPARDFPEGRITSCYFDTRGLDEYHATLDGDFDKQKVRLRWYDDISEKDTTMAFIEVKKKSGFETRKNRELINVSSGSLRRGAFDSILPPQRLRPFLRRLDYSGDAQLLPVSVISYQRLRFRAPGTEVGVSLDFNITASLPRGGAKVPLGTAIIEIKGADMELLPSLRKLGRFGSTWSAHSKYGLALELLLTRGGPWPR